MIPREPLSAPAGHPNESQAPDADPMPGEGESGTLLSDQFGDANVEVFVHFRPITSINLVDHALLVDQNEVGYASDAPRLCQFVVLNCEQIRVAVLSSVLLCCACGVVLLKRVGADSHKALLAESGVEFLDQGRCGLAGPTPGSPKVKQHYFALE